MRLRDLRVGLLVYFVGRDYVYAVLHNQTAGSSARFRLVACRDVLVEMDRLTPALTGACSEGRAEALLREFAAGWGRTLLPPGRALAGLDVIVMIPHSVLHGLPLHAICLETSDKALALECGVVYAPSGTVAVRCASRNPARNRKWNRWEFPLKEGRPKWAPAVPQRCIAVASDVLHGNEEQFRHLAGTFASSFPEGKAVAGGRDVAKRAASWADAICLVCHGHYDDSFPGRSGVLFGPPRFYGDEKILLPGIGLGSFADLPFGIFPPQLATHTGAPGDIVTVEELRVTCRTSAELVALVGCSTAAGTLVASDEFQNLAVQWLNAGAVSALAGSWSVDLRYAEDWTPRFLERWIDRRQPKVIAFREALHETLASNDVPISQWGALVLLGDWV